MMLVRGLVRAVMLIDLGRNRIDVKKVMGKDKEVELCETGRMDGAGGDGTESAARWEP